MELKAFLAELVTSLARLDFVASLELRTEVFTVKGRVHLTQRGFPLHSGGKKAREMAKKKTPPGFSMGCSHWSRSKRNIKVSGY